MSELDENAMPLAINPSHSQSSHPKALKGNSCLFQPNVLPINVTFSHLSPLKRLGNTWTFSASTDSLLKLSKIEWFVHESFPKVKKLPIMREEILGWTNLGPQTQRKSHTEYIACIYEACNKATNQPSCQWLTCRVWELCPEHKLKLRFGKTAVV